MQTGMFALPEVRAAFKQWQATTGLDQTSPEWGEVWQVLKDSGLLAQAQQAALFDDPDTAPDQTRALRLAIMGGAVLYRQLLGQPQRAGLEGLSIAQCTAMAAALIERFYQDNGLLGGLDVWQALTLLERELPVRVRGVVRSPEVALRWQLRDKPRRETDHTGTGHSLLDHVLAEAVDNDDFAHKVFARTHTDPCVRLGLEPLCTGEWLLYSTAPGL